MRKRSLCCRPVSVCPSVCHVGALYVVKLLSQPSSSVILVFLTPSADTQFQGEPRQQGGKILRFSTEIAVYIENGTR